MKIEKLQAVEEGNNISSLSAVSFGTGMLGSYGV